MKSAIFTIVKNEKFFLKKLEDYYKNQFDDIYILNHDSTDGSIEDLSPETKVINIENDVVFDHVWLNQTVKNFQKKLLEVYDIVCFVEADEFLIHRTKTLRQVCQDLYDSESEAIMCHGYALYDDGEKYDINKTILSQKKKFKRDIHYDKVLISKIPIDWMYGFHNVRNLQSIKCEFHDDFYLIHLHNFDTNVFLERVNDRLKLQEKFSNDGMAIHNQQTDIQYYIDLMNHISNQEGEDLELPDKF